MTIQKALEQLKKSDKRDNEGIHSDYDTLMCAIAEAYQPKIKKEADEIVKGVPFWYA